MTTFSDTKAANSVAPFTMSWADLLNANSPADAISSSAWAATDATIDSDSNTTTTTTAVVSGGTDYTYATITNTIVTTSGYTYVRSIVLSIQPR